MENKKILIANRGEIACRVIRTARRLGYRTVAVYSRADAGAPHVLAADEAVLIGPPPAIESYLDIAAVVEAARKTGAGAVHPGYGFLAENADFARACDEAGLVFIGPTVDAIELMGDKRAAKARMTEAGVPCVPGDVSTEQDDAALRSAAESIGYPVMIKAAAGGGGRGMRLVTDAAELGEALVSARSEAENSFGSGVLLLEKAIVEPRHVELQIFGDTHGNYLHLGERDCSVQRRHQKVIEECPSPAVDDELRRRMGATAVEAARACGYVGAGTVEFLLDREGNFYFLEMNTRLQVEHPVTELVTGFDLVEWQIRIADGEPLPVSQDAIVLTGHAIEARLYAEDPARGFLPQTGRVLVWESPRSGNVRIDHAVHAGGTVSPHYDPLLAKVIAHGATRDDARRKLASALRDTTLFGVTTNKSFLANICDHEMFAAGGATTAFLADHFAGDSSMQVTPPDRLNFAMAALAILVESTQGLVEDDGFIGWRSAGPVWSTITLAGDDGEAAMQVDALGRDEAGGMRFVMIWADEAETAGEGVEPQRVELELVRHVAGTLEVIADGIARRVRYACDAERIWLDDGRTVRVYTDITHAPAEIADTAGSGRLVAPFDGAVMDLRVAVGDRVERGQVLLILEAMKMEHRIIADVDGKVVSLQVSEGNQVKTRQPLAEIEPAVDNAGEGG